MKFYFSKIIKRNIYKMETISKWSGGETKPPSLSLARSFSVSLSGVIKHDAASGN